MDLLPPVGHGGQVGLPTSFRQSFTNLIISTLESRDDFHNRPSLTSNKSVPLLYQVSYLEISLRNVEVVL